MRGRKRRELCKLPTGQYATLVAKDGSHTGIRTYGEEICAHGDRTQTTRGVNDRFRETRVDRETRRHRRRATLPTQLSLQSLRWYRLSPRARIGHAHDPRDRIERLDETGSLHQEIGARACESHV
jgi:hypothetical protein